jgi:hypothetical protein
VKLQSLRQTVAEKLSMSRAPPFSGAVHPSHDVNENSKSPVDVVSKREPRESDVELLRKK